MEIKTCVHCHQDCGYVQSFCCDTHNYCVPCIISLYDSQMFSAFCECCFNEKFTHSDCYCGTYLKNIVFSFFDNNIVTIYVFNVPYLYTNKILSIYSDDYTHPSSQVLDTL